MPDDTTQGPIEPEFKATMNALAYELDCKFNGDARGDDRQNCFVLLAAKFAKDGETVGPGRTNYISNGNRADIVAMMKELVARFEQQESKP